MPNACNEGITQTSWTRPTWLIAIALAGFVGSAVLVATGRGIGVSNDGISYLRQAEAIRDHGDLYSTGTHYPPGWPLLVAGVGVVTRLSLLASGRLLNVLAICVLLLVACRAMTVNGRLVGPLHIVGAVFFCLTYPVYTTSTYALTETVFLVGVVMCLLCLDRFDMSGRYEYLLAAAVLAAGSGLVRYVGVTLLVPIAISALRCSRGGISRLTSLAWASAVTLTPIGLWLLAAPASPAESHLSSNKTAGLGQAWPSLEQLTLALVNWDVPRLRFLYGLLGVVAIAIPVIAIVAIARTQVDTSSSTAITRLERLSLLPWILFGATYLALIATQRWWINREIISRYWSPFVLAAVVITLRVISDIRARHPIGTNLVRAASAVLVIATSLNVVKAISFTNDARSSGLGWEADDWRNSEFFSDIAAHSSDLVFTNQPAGVRYYLPDRITRDILTDPVHDWSCNSLTTDATNASNAPLVIALLGPTCSRDEVVDRILDRLPGAIVAEYPEVWSRLILWDGVPLDSD